MKPNIVTDTVLWMPPSDDQVIDLAAGNPPVLEFIALVAIDLTATHGVEITLERLQEMAASYDPSIETASLNIDHAWGGPSLGWCEKVWLEDGNFWVRYVDLDPGLVEALRAKRYTRRSAEIVYKHQATSGWYFSGCALLGNKRPAIPGLPPITLCRPQYVLDLSQKETNPMPQAPPAPPAPSPAPAPAQQEQPPTPPAAGAAEVATLLAQVAKGEQALATILRQNALLTADRRLKELGSRITPAMERLAKPLLIELLSAPAPLTLKLAADPAKPAELSEIAIADQVIAILAACPGVEALSAGRMADEDPAASAAASSGVTPERQRELDAKYHFSTRAFGYRREVN